jgi:hypothetical protein
VGRLTLGFFTRGYDPSGWSGNRHQVLQQVDVKEGIMNYASQLVRVLATRCQTLVLAARSVLLVSVVLAVTNSVDARSNPPNKTVAQAPPVTATTSAEPCNLQRFDENSDFLFVPDPFGVRRGYRRTWIGNTHAIVSEQCSR